MKRITHSLKRINIARILSKSIILGLLATVSIVASSIVTTSSKANAQTPSPIDSTEITNYSRALLTIEQSRIQAFEEIKKISGGKELPAIVCNQPKTIESLSTGKARDIVKKYCQRSQTIVQDNGLSIERFNNITLKLQNDESLKRQIYNTLIRLQKKPN
ncbi:DUF4168 domain-containing protein [Rivularia sp. UHCC 0363]|uniref:DUF4168 domain-containing protein n=1 Tax=Rivularia sp. UHCC 0363 TaxID=3110244 RepID=UPI002B21216F|nr:DUF4168 domain-containing protein [Rivularia sp. UHCC 0363]MEA5592873.1 DUF4168 domain-containing protein [Rivularia sp. UHCC 0363]